MQIIAPRHTFDVIVVGSGASGGWAAKRLAEAGVKVALADAGGLLMDAASSEHVRRFELKHRDEGARADPRDETRAEGVLRLHGWPTYAHELAVRALPFRSGIGAVPTPMVHLAANARDRSSNQDETTVTMPARSSPLAAPRGNMTNRLPSALMS